MEREEAEKERMKEEEERRQRKEEAKRRSRILEAAFDGDNDEILAVLEEVGTNFHSNSMCGKNDIYPQKKRDDMPRGDFCP